MIKNLCLVSDSVEWPNVFFGSFDETFFDLPEFLLKTILSEKQDNFTFKRKWKIKLFLWFRLKFRIK